MVSEGLKILDKLTKDGFPIGTEVRNTEGGDWGEVVGYNESETVWNGLKERTEPYVKVKHYFGFEKEYPGSQIEHWLGKQRYSNFLVGLYVTSLCRLGIHAFEEEPARRDLLKGTGIDFGFWSSAIQKAVKVCTRYGCEVQKKVYRSGMCGVGGVGDNWKKLTTKKEQYIDSIKSL